MLLKKLHSCRDKFIFHRRNAMDSSRSRSIGKYSRVDNSEGLSLSLSVQENTLSSKSYRNAKDSKVN